MTQGNDEWHALHTFRGFTGSTLGLSAQKTTSAQCFTAAATACFDHHLADHVQFIFSDSPGRIFSAARAFFKGLLGVGEDSIHLPIRLEYCWNGKTTDASQRVRQLHHKFHTPTPTIEPFWQPGDNLGTSIPWPVSPILDERTSAEWSAFCKVPFEKDNGYASYVSELAIIGATYPDLLRRKNNKGVTALTILKNGSSRQHFEGLQNASRLIARLGPFGVRLGTGTARNEQLHREIKAWSRNIYQTHKGRLQDVFRIFELAKLLTHSSAGYSPTLTQFGQQKLLSLIAGRLRRNGFFPPVHSAHETSLIPTNVALNTLHTPFILETSFSSFSRKNTRDENKQNWKKREKRMRSREPSSTNIFRRVRKKQH